VSPRCPRTARHGPALLWIASNGKVPVAFEDPVAHGQEGSVVLLVLLDNRRAGRGISADAGGLYAVARLLRGIADDCQQRTDAGNKSQAGGLRMSLVDALLDGWRPAGRLPRGEIRRAGS
jgi:hypothetical protein